VPAVPISEPQLSAGDLAAFVAAVETGTVHAAAEALDLTQSAATKRISALERRLGVPLLVRSRTGVEPTDLGRLLYPEAKHVLVALDAAQRVVTERAMIQRPLRLAASQTVGEFLLPSWLAAFRAADGAVHVQLDVRNSPAVLRELRDGDVEIGFVEGPDALDDLDVLALLRDEIVAVVAPRHPWARRHAIGLTDLPREQFLTREAGSGTRAVAEAALAERGVTLEPTLELASTQSLKRTVLSGGFTLLSRVAVQAEHDAGALTILPVHGVDLHRELRAVRVRGRRHGAAARRFWSFLDDRARPTA